MNEGAQPVKRPKKPANQNAAPDGATSTDGTAKRAPHVNQESFIIPGTATGPDKPITNPQKTGPSTGPEKTNAAILTAAPGAVIREQHQ
jgi:hypothetical protein